jgi:hypothetical protein
MSETYADFEPDDDGCYLCGGSGFLDDECECQAFEDICMCLHPMPRACPECIRYEREKRRREGQGGGS